MASRYRKPHASIDDEASIGTAMGQRIAHSPQTVVVDARTCIECDNACDTAHWKGAPWWFTR